MQVSGRGAEIAIVIPHYDDNARLARCLNALMAQDCAEVEIIVVDNGSPISPASDIEAHKAIGLIVEPTKGAAAARNRGVAETSAPWIVFLDADCVPEPGWLAACRGAARDPNGAVGGRVDVFDETAPPRSGAQAFETVFAFHQRDNIERKGFSVSANLLVSREAFARVGPFRTGLSEDIDWCWRAPAAGVSLRYDPTMAVLHPTRTDWPALKRKWRRLTTEFFGLQRRDLRGRLIWAAQALAMGPSALWHVPRILRHERLTPAERIRAMLCMLRLRLARMVWMLCLLPTRDRFR